MVRLTTLQSHQRDQQILDMLNLQPMTAVEITTRLNIQNHQSVYYHCRHLLKDGKVLMEVRKNPVSGLYAEYYCLIIEKNKKIAPKSRKTWNRSLTIRV